MLFDVYLMFKSQDLLLMLEQFLAWKPV